MFCCGSRFSCCFRCCFSCRVSVFFCEDVPFCLLSGECIWKFLGLSRCFTDLGFFDITLFLFPIQETGDWIGANPKKAKQTARKKRSVFAEIWPISRNTRKKTHSTRRLQFIDMGHDGIAGLINVVLISYIIGVRYRINFIPCRRHFDMH